MNMSELISTINQALQDQDKSVKSIESVASAIAKSPLLTEFSNKYLPSSLKNLLDTAIAKEVHKSVDLVSLNASDSKVNSSNVSAYINAAVSPFVNDETPNPQHSELLYALYINVKSTEATREYIAGPFEHEKRTSKILRKMK